MAKRAPYRVLVAEDEPLLLENIVSKIEKAGLGFKVVASAANGADALELARQLKPDVLFTDIRMPMLDGLALCEEVQKAIPGIHMVIVSGFGDFGYAQQAMKLGVKHYLLKPASLESLTEALQDIQKKLEHHHQRAIESLITSRLSGDCEPDTIPDSLQDDIYVVQLICLGNLYRHAMEAAESQMFHKLWAQVNWSHMVTHRLGASVKWRLIAERSANLKYLVVAGSQATLSDTLSWGEELRNQIASYLSPSIHITVCTHKSPIGLFNLKTMARSLRHTLRQQLMPCHSSMLVEPPAPNASIPCYSIETWGPKLLELLLIQKKEERLPDEVLKILNIWKQSRCSQELLEKSCLRLFSFIFEHLGTQMAPYAFEAKLYRIIAQATDINALVEQIVQLIVQALPLHTKIENAEQLCQAIEEYMHLHYAKTITIDTLAEVFRYNASYLIRIFKKHTGMTPLQYLITLRINEAKQLIEHLPDMEFKDIAQLVGYTNQHYFSKAFKHVTGLKPTEYRDLLGRDEKGICSLVLKNNGAVRKVNL